MDNKTIVTTAWTEALVNQDPSAVDRYWGPAYVQHNPQAPDGPDAVKGLIGMLSSNPDFRYELVRVIGDGDLVALHGRYAGWMDAPVIVVDLVRLEGGRMVEHWDVVQLEAGSNPSGRTMLDGPTEVEDLESTEANRDLVTRFVQTVLVGGRFDQMGTFFDGDTYIQHNSQIPDGVSGLVAAIGAMAEQGLTMVYTRLHRVVAEGSFVLTQSEGTFAGAPYAYYDLFRVRDGFIAEHWDVMQQIPTESANSNGMF
jgi:predicted SnoaL-like aldol condensation-catalyzing enzyme